ncbi:MAG: hypothetical protein NVS4B8_02960 [Herpetosiphon sp.]
MFGAAVEIAKAGGFSVGGDKDGLCAGLPALGLLRPWWDKRQF